MTDHCKTCGQPTPPKPIRPCNMCGHPCGVPPGRNDPGDQKMGLVDVVVRGGYWSTPGNGDGALDDCTSYNFSICEFCLDWLFQRFAIPVARDGCSAAASDPYRPADQRVAEDEWRKMKKEFFAEFEKRNASRAAAACVRCRIGSTPRAPGESDAAASMSLDRGVNPPPHTCGRR